MEITNKVQDAILGVIVGDVLGVPFEFKSRQEMSLHPATDMIGYGTHNQPSGTWSDDGSLTMCLLESLTKGYDLEDISRNFIAWRDQGFWSAIGNVFDIGITTSRLIAEVTQIC